jgi:hypothetical protein
VISITTKERELATPFPARAAERAESRLERVEVHSFGDEEASRAAQAAAGDLRSPEAWAGEGSDAAAFALGVIARWWEAVGSVAYPDTTRLLVTVDGGPGGSRNRLWYHKLVALAQGTGLEVTVCHFPRGTSTGNKIERLLSPACRSTGEGRTSATRSSWSSSE